MDMVVVCVACMGSGDMDETWGCAYVRRKCINTYVQVCKDMCKCVKECLHVCEHVCMHVCTYVCMHGSIYLRMYRSHALTRGGMGVVELRFVDPASGHQVLLCLAHVPWKL